MVKHESLSASGLTSETWRPRMSPLRSGHRKSHSRTLPLPAAATAGASRLEPARSKAGDSEPTFLLESHRIRLEGLQRQAPSLFSLPRTQSQQHRATPEGGAMRLKPLLRRVLTVNRERFGPDRVLCLDGSLQLPACREDIAPSGPAQKNGNVQGCKDIAELPHCLHARHLERNSGPGVPCDQVDLCR